MSYLPWCATSVGLLFVTQLVLGETETKIAKLNWPLG
jgi:hypothetical protein